MCINISVSSAVLGTHAAHQLLVVRTVSVELTAICSRYRLVCTSGCTFIFVDFETHELCHCILWSKLTCVLEWDKCTLSLISAVRKGTSFLISCHPLRARGLSSAVFARETAQTLHRETYSSSVSLRVFVSTCFIGASLDIQSINSSRVWHAHHDRFDSFIWVWFSR